MSYRNLAKKWRATADDLLAKSQLESDPDKKAILSSRAMVYIACVVELQTAGTVEAIREDKARMERIGIVDVRMPGYTSIGEVKTITGPREQDLNDDVTRIIDIEYGSGI